MGSVQEFFRTAIRDLGHVGALFPSSSFASRTVVAQVPDESQCIVEYGPGTGAITRALLDKLGHGGKLIGVEVNETFAVQLQEDVGDSRLNVVHGDIREISQGLRTFAPRGVDAVISGIPFSFLSKETRERLLENTRQALRPGGVFVVYQHTPKMLEELERCFGRVERHFEVRNIPPYFIMVARKQHSS